MRQPKRGLSHLPCLSLISSDSILAHTPLGHPKTNSPYPTLFFAGSSIPKICSLTLDDLHCLMGRPWLASESGRRLRFGTYPIDISIQEQCLIAEQLFQLGTCKGLMDLNRSISTIRMCFGCIPAWMCNVQVFCYLRWCAELKGKA